MSFETTNILSNHFGTVQRVLYTYLGITILMIVLIFLNYKKYGFRNLISGKYLRLIHIILLLACLLFLFCILLYSIFSYILFLVNLDLYRTDYYETEEKMGVQWQKNRHKIVIARKMNLTRKEICI